MAMLAPASYWGDAHYVPVIVDMSTGCVCRRRARPRPPRAAYREDHRGPRGLLFPHAVQAVQVIRRRQPPAGGPATTEVVYA